MGTGNGGMGWRWFVWEPLNTATPWLPHSLDRTDANPPGGGGYYRASGFLAENLKSAHGVFAHGLVHVRALTNESTWSYIQAQNQYGDAWHIDRGRLRRGVPSHCSIELGGEWSAERELWRCAAGTVGTGAWIPSAATTLNSNVVTGNANEFHECAGGDVYRGCRGTGGDHGDRSELRADADHVGECTATATGVPITVNASNGEGPGPSGISISDSSINSPRSACRISRSLAGTRWQMGR